MAHTARPTLGRIASVLTLLALLLPAVARGADEPADEAADVYQKLKPSVVSIANAEGSGTGILLDDTGLILTCAHVVTSPMPYTVKIDASTGDEAKDVTYKHVTIVGFHPERDLALIRIDPHEPTDAPKLVPVTVGKDKARSGQRIYAIGDPGAGSQVMTKTITQGIVSGVDRVFDDQKFYQIDAAVNPGNSGGPVVDHLGRVIGIVTFQFNDLQALNFAIPLNDIDFTKFVPLTEHKANPQRAGVLLKYAKQFAAEAAKAAEGSDERKQYAAYAAYCYEEALVYDPSNPDIYDDIGTQHVLVGNDDAAEAYLVRAVELRPWDPPTADPYRQLGRAYRDQKQDAKATAAWAEGLAKFPYAPGIWDDRAHYPFDSVEFADAAYDASVALACGPRPARVTSLQKLLRSARGHLDDAGTTDLNRRVAHDAVANDLDQMRQRSNRSRKRRSLYVTAPFVALMKVVGNLDVPGVEDRIGQSPLRAPAKLAIGDDASTADDDESPKKPADGGGGKARPNHPDEDNGADPGPDKPPAADAGGDDKPDHPPGRKGKPRITHPDQDPDDTPDAGMSGGSAAPKRQAEAAGGTGDDWLGTKAKSAPAAGGPATKPAEVISPNVILPRPAVTGIDLAGDVQTVDDAKVVPVDVDAAVVSDVVLSPDGTTAYVVQKDGLLRKLAVPSLKEERQTDMGSAVAGIGLTRDGLAVAVSSVNEIWLLDPVTLEVKHRVALSGVTRLVTSPDRTGVLAAIGTDRLAVVEPSTEKVSARFTAPDLASSSGGKVTDVRFDQLALAPDGRHLYLEGSGCICKFGWTGSTLSFQAAGPKLGTATALMVSPDGRYVAMPCRTGDAPVPGQPTVPFATYMFRATDLDAAVMTVQTGPTPGPMAFDGVAHQLYGQNDTRQLIVFAPTGEKVKDYVVVPNATTQKLLVSPDGRKLFVLAGGKLVWVTLP